MKKGFKVLGILAAIPVILFVYLLVVLTLSSGGASGLFVHGVKPKIKEAEFDFKLVYEVYEQTYEYEGSFVCKFEGFINGGGAKDRKWSNTYKDQNGQIVDHYKLYDLDEHQIFLIINNPRYFMSDPKQKSSEEYYVSICETETGYAYTGSIAEASLLKKCGFKIISWECDPPIENKYR